MKLLISFACIVGCFLGHSVIHAHCCWTKDNPGFYDLRAELKNMGTENCNLEQSDIQKGALYASNIPVLLPATGEVFYVTWSGSEIEATLTYSCGEHKRISLFMRQYVKKNHKHTSIESNAINALDVFEHHTVKPNELGCCSTHDRFGLVSWTLSH